MFVNDSTRSSMIPTGDVCLTCLSEARKMYPIQNKEFFSSVTLFKVPPDCTYKLCWECHTMLIKIKKFRIKALQAQKILKSKSNKVQIQSLSSLKVRVPTHLYILCKPCQETSQPDVQMLPQTFKQENVNSTLNSMLQGTNCNQQDPLSEVTVKVEFEDISEKGTQLKDAVKCEIEDVSFHDEPILPANNSNPCIDIKSEVNATGHESVPIINSQVPIINNSWEDVIRKNIILQPTLYVSSTSNVAMNNSNSFPVIVQNKPNIQMPLLCVTSSNPTPTLAVSHKPIANLTPTLAVSHKPIANLTPTLAVSHKPIEYKGLKLFKNSPQLPKLMPKPLLSVEAQDKPNNDTENRDKKPFVIKKRREIQKSPIDYLDFMTDDVPDDNVFEVKMLTKEELVQRREESLRTAKAKHYLYFCEKCMMKFTKRNFRVHLTDHDESAGPFSCSICELRFSTQEFLDQHKEEHYKLYICVTCKTEFNNYVLMMRHYYRHHKEVLKFCEICKVDFTNNRAFDLHKQKHQIECEVCHEKVRRSKLSAHMEKHVKRSRVTCDVCGKKYCRPEVLEKHKVIAHSQGSQVADEAYYCIECDLAFKTKLLYNVHVRYTVKHIGKKFTCEQCNKCYATQMGLKRHILVYHDLIERSQCDICKKTFNCKNAVRHHIERKHLKTLKKNKICDICGKAFENKACLQQHMNSHLKLRPYKCEECGATFSYSGARYTHIKLKHKKNKEKKVIDEAQ